MSRSTGADHSLFSAKGCAAAAMALVLACAGLGGCGMEGQEVSQLAVVPLDNKVILVNGVQTIVKNPAPDLVTVVDIGAMPPKVVGDIENVPASVIGPPFSVAVSPDGRFALVTACMKIDPADATKQTEDNRVSVIDLKSQPMRVVATVEAGKGPAGVSINHAGTLALVANRGDGSVSIFSISGMTLKNIGTLAIGNAASALGHVVFTPDGKRALVTRDGDNTVTMLAVDGEKVTLAGRDIKTGLRPYAIDVTSDGALAVVGNVGAGNGDVDTVGVIDLVANPPRLVDTVRVPMTPEGMKLSPDGKYVAVGSQDGSNKPPDSPFYHDHGTLTLFRLEGTGADARLKKVASAPVGHWSQGIAFSGDGRTIVVDNMVEKELQVFKFDLFGLHDAGKIPLRGGPVAIRTAE